MALEGLAVDDETAGAEADPSEIRFPRALALSYGKELEFARMRRSLDAALALDPEDAETAEILFKDTGDKIRRTLEKKIPGAPHESLLVVDAAVGRMGPIDPRPVGTDTLFQVYEAGNPLLSTVALKEVARGALRAENPELLTVILPQTIGKQPREIRDLLAEPEGLGQSDERVRKRGLGVS